MKVVSSILPKDELMKTVRENYPNIQFHFFRSIDEAKGELVDADIFVTLGNDLTEQLILSADNLKWIMVMSAGIEDIPLNLCHQRGVKISNARGIHKIPMSEFVIGQMLQYEKKFKQLWENENQSKWDRKLPFAELSGKTVLILGTGAIGTEVARLAKAFNMKTIGVNSNGRQIDNFDKTLTFNEIEINLRKTDYLISILPSTQTTKGLLTEEHFKLMKKTAVFINIGRGDVVSESTLLKVAEKELIAHLFLDVFEREPLNSNHSFWSLKNVTVTPHISSISENYFPRSFEIFNENLKLFQEKERLINEISYEKGY